MRGRNRNNKGPNPLTRSYDSNGPDVKIRGTAQHIADKYTQLARDAQVSGDPVAAENYFQHAEHYYRIIAAAQEQFRPAFNAYQRPYEEGDDEDEESGSFGYGGADRPPQGSFGQQGGQGEDDLGSQPQPFEPRSEGGQRFDRGRPDRGDRFDRGGERGDGRADPRQDRGDRQEYRPNRGERFDRGDRRDRFARGDRGGDRFEDRGERQPRGEFQPKVEQPRPEPAPRDEFPRRERAREEAEAPETGGLPAFLTNPTRPAITMVDPSAEQPSPGDEAADAGASEANGRFPRRRRRRRIDAPDGAANGEGTDTAAE